MKKNSGAPVPQVSAPLCSCNLRCDDELMKTLRSATSLPEHYICCPTRARSIIPPSVLRHVLAAVRQDAMEGDDATSRLLEHHIFCCCWTPLCAAVKQATPAAAERQNGRRQVSVVAVRLSGYLSRCAADEPIFAPLHDAAAPPSGGVDSNGLSKIVVPLHSSVSQYAATPLLHPTPIFSTRLDVVLCVAFSTVLRVVRLPVLEVFTGPSCLVLCPTLQWCDELVHFMRKVADDFHLVVHNSFGAPPLMPSERRADIVVASPKTFVSWWLHPLFVEQASSPSNRRRRLPSPFCSSRLNMVQAVRHLCCGASTASVSAYSYSSPPLFAPMKLYGLDAIRDLVVTDLESQLDAGQLSALDIIFCGLGLNGGGGGGGGELRMTFVDLGTPTSEIDKIQMALIDQANSPSSTASPSPAASASGEGCTPPSLAILASVRADAFPKHSLPGDRKRQRDDSDLPAPPARDALEGDGRTGSWAVVLINVVSCTSVELEGADLLREISSEVHRVIAEANTGQKAPFSLRVELCLLMAGSMGQSRQRNDELAERGGTTLQCASGGVASLKPAVVCYSLPEDVAMRAAKTLHGVVFDGRPVVAVACPLCVLNEHIADHPEATIPCDTMSALARIGFKLFWIDQTVVDFSLLGDDERTSIARALSERERARLAGGVVSEHRLRPKPTSVAEVRAAAAMERGGDSSNGPSSSLTFPRAFRLPLVEGLSELVPSRLMSSGSAFGQVVVRLKDSNLATVAHWLQNGIAGADDTRPSPIEQLLGLCDVFGTVSSYFVADSSSPRSDAETSRPDGQADASKDGDGMEEAGEDVLMDLDDVFQRVCDEVPDDVITEAATAPAGACAVVFVEFLASMSAIECVRVIGNTMLPPWAAVASAAQHAIQPLEAVLVDTMSYYQMTALGADPALVRAACT